MPNTLQSSLPSDEIFRIKPLKGRKKEGSKGGGWNLEYHQLLNSFLVS